MKVVISLGGSLTVPDRIDIRFLVRFRDAVRKFSRHKIVVVTGGGRIARDYIHAIDGSEKAKSMIGIKTTRLNAILVSNILGCGTEIPLSKHKVIEFLGKKNLVVCGALGYAPKMTSDGTAAQIAAAINADVYIKISNVKGIYDKDPRKFKDAKFISRMSFEGLNEITKDIKFKAGQHFILGQKAARFVIKESIATVVLTGLKNLENCLAGKKFVGTVIS